MKAPVLLTTLPLLAACGMFEPSGNEDGRVIVGIYSGEGAADACVVAATCMFEWMGYETRHLQADDINGADVSDIDLFYFPGGSSAPYLSLITPAGRDVIRNAVGGGCGFIGTCAGALYACEKQVWDGVTVTEEQLGLFHGTGSGPNPEIFAYPEIGMCRVDIDTAHVISQNHPDSIWVMFYNGPCFEQTNPGDPGVFIVGRYALTGRAAFVACTFGNGRVFLTGPHPEWEEDSDRDGITLFKEYDDQGSDWDLMRSAAEWCLD